MNASLTSTALRTPSISPKSRAHARKSFDFAGTASRVVAQNETARLFWTSVTPGALHAADPASSRSSQELTVPARVTLPPSAETSMFSASISASRLRAFSIASLIAVGWTLGLRVMLLQTPLTPGQISHSIRGGVALEAPCDATRECYPSRS